jgi:trimeric autotransporter adhesin
MFYHLLSTARTMAGAALCLLIAMVLALPALQASQPAVAAGSVLLDPSSLPSLGALSAVAGTISFNTETGHWLVNGSPASGIGDVNSGGSGLTAFTFDNISVATGVIVNYTGSGALALLSKGNVMFAGTLAGDALGSGGGGLRQSGFGLGGGGTGGSGAGGGGGSFGSYGGAGGSGSSGAPGGLAGPTYGVNDLSALGTFPIGSGGGGAGDSPLGCGTQGHTGGAGGGGIALISLGSVTLDSATLSVRGHTGGDPALVGAGNGGGSGGALLIVAPAYSDSGASVDARGGYGSPASQLSSPSGCSLRGGGGGGGGGRITLVAGSPLSAILPQFGSLGGDGYPGGTHPGGTGGLPVLFQRSFVTLAAATPGLAASAMPFTATLAVGSASSFAWDFGDGGHATTPGGATLHAYAAPGTYTATATATMSGTGALSSGAVSVLVDEAPLGGLSASNSSPSVFGSATAFTATVGTGSNVTYTWSFGDGTGPASGAAITHTYSAAGAYGAVVTATNSVSQLTATTPVSISKASQTITFNPLPDRRVGDPPFTVSATATSGLSVTFSATGTCSVLGSTVTLTGAGQCTISAHQAGNPNYSPAPDVPRSFMIRYQLFLPLVIKN